MIKVGICGFGYWGPNLLRNFSASPRFSVRAVADTSRERQERARLVGRSLRTYSSAEELIDDAEIDAVAIATPVLSHYPLALRAIERGKHVLIEKPMCSSVAEANDLVERADYAGVRLIVNHTFLFTGAVETIAKLHRTGALGKVSYYDSMRVNLGLFQPDVNVIWDLAPHDFSIMLHILEEEPVHIEATGYCHVNPHLADIAYITMHFRSQTVAHFNLSWMSPVKVRRIAIGGSRQMLVWDDLDREEKLKIYNSGISFQAEALKPTIVPDYRIGDIYSPRLSNHEPLAAMVDHFAEAITGGVSSIADGRQGVRVVRMLEAAQQALDENFARTAKSRAPQAAVS